MKRADNRQSRPREPICSGRRQPVGCQGAWGGGGGAEGDGGITRAQEAFWSGSRDGYLGSGDIFLTFVKNHSHLLRQRADLSGAGHDFSNLNVGLGLPLPRPTALAFVTTTAKHPPLQSCGIVGKRALTLLLQPCAYHLQPVAGMVSSKYG